MEQTDVDFGLEEISKLVHYELVSCKSSLFIRDFFLNVRQWAHEARVGLSAEGFGDISFIRQYPRSGIRSHIFVCFAAAVVGKSTSALAAVNHRMPTAESGTSQPSGLLHDLSR